MNTKVVDKVFRVLFLFAIVTVAISMTTQNAQGQVLTSRPLNIIAIESPTIYHVATPDIVPVSCTGGWDTDWSYDCQNTLDNDLGTVATLNANGGRIYYTVPAGALSLPPDATNIQVCFNFNFADYVSAKYAFHATFDGSYPYHNQSIQFDLKGKKFTNCYSVSPDLISTINDTDTNYWIYFWAGDERDYNHLQSFSLYYAYDSVNLPVPTPTNRAPSFVSGPYDVTINLGEDYGIWGYFVDQDSTNWIATVDYGDGSEEQTLAFYGQYFYLNHLYQADGIYSVTVRVTDDQVNTATRIGMITVQSRTYKNLSTGNIIPTSCIGTWNSDWSYDCENTLDNDLSTVATLNADGGRIYYTVLAGNISLPSDAINIQLCMDFNFTDYLSTRYAFGASYDSRPYPTQGVQYIINSPQFGNCYPVSSSKITAINATDVNYWIYFWGAYGYDHLANLRLYYTYDSNILPIPTYNTPSGTNVIVQPIDSTTSTTPVSLTFASVSQSGDTSLTTSSTGKPPLYGFRLGAPPKYYEIQTTAIFNQATVCIDYSDTSLDTNINREKNLKLFHEESGNWVDRTISLDTITNIICAQVASFSQFAILDPNLPPVISQITASVNPALISSHIDTTALFTDPDKSDHHVASWNWGDGSTSTGTVSEADGSGTIVGDHVYISSGVYTINVTVTDGFGKADTSTFQYIVIYNPNGGFVTGGGWIMSPPGAYTPDPTLTGKVTFGFVSKYQKSTKVPTGNTEFQFQVGNLNFKSASYEWLAIAGSKAQYKGVGTINGKGNYGFILTATDGTPDKFRIKIWDVATGQVVYDNMLGAPDTDDPVTAVGGGSIVIHREK